MKTLFNKIIATGILGAGLTFGIAGNVNGQDTIVKQKKGFPITAKYFFEPMPILKSDTIFNFDNEIAKVMYSDQSKFIIEDFKDGKIISVDEFYYDKNKKLKFYRRKEIDNKVGAVLLKEDWDGDGHINLRKYTQKKINEIVQEPIKSSIYYEIID